MTLLTHIYDFSTLFFLILWPMPLYGTGYIFSKQFFTGWVVVGIIWIFCSFIAVVIYPAWESRATIMRVTRHMFGGKSSQGEFSREPVIVAEGSGTVTPERKGGNVSDGEKP